MSRPTAGQLIARALQLRCPRCGEAKMFTGLIRMHDTCPACGMRFEREPGYFLGSIYINYGLTALITTIAYVTLRFGWNVESKLLPFSLLAFCVVFPLFFFRYARALWLALDLRFESEQFFQGKIPVPGGPHE